MWVSFGFCLGTRPNGPLHIVSTGVICIYMIYIYLYFSILSPAFIWSSILSCTFNAREDESVTDVIVSVRANKTVKITFISNWGMGCPTLFSVPRFY